MRVINDIIDYETKIKLQYEESTISLESKIRNILTKYYFESTLHSSVFFYT